MKDLADERRQAESVAQNLYCEFGPKIVTEEVKKAFIDAYITFAHISGMNGDYVSRAQALTLLLNVMKMI